MHERDLFLAALEIDDEAARRAYLDEACVDDSILRSRVERLLNHAGEAGDFLEQPAADLCSGVDAELLTQSDEPELTNADPPTMIGKADDTEQTMLLNQQGSATAESRFKVAAPSQSGVTPASSVFGTLFGRYRVERELGAGGMGVVYLAEDLRLGRRVALKIPKFDADEKLHLSDRFRREARTMASVLHRNLCPIFDVDEQDGTHYLTMAFIEGETLSQIIKRTDGDASRQSRESSRQVLTSPTALPFTSRQIAELIRKLALALDEAHRAGIIHRDLKPANVMFDRSGEPILMDFGLAWMVHEADSRMTQSGAIVGTPAYMAPEQAAGETDKVGAASDIYSLGAILYELLTGRPIYSGGVTRVLFKLMHETPTRPSQVRDDIDPKLEEICWKAIARRPEDRFTTAADFAEALARYLDLRSTSTSDLLSVTKKLDPRSDRVVVSDQTEVIPSDSGAETIAYLKPTVSPINKPRIVLASLLLIGILGAVWMIVAGREKVLDGVVVNITPQTTLVDGKNPPKPGGTPGVLELAPEPVPAIAPFETAQAKQHQAVWARHLGKKVEIVNRAGSRLILIPPGAFMMGSTDEQVAEASKVAEETNAEAVTKDRIKKVERPQHRVVITKPFFMGATEVSVGQFKKFAAMTGYRTEAEKLAKGATSETYLAPGYPVTDDSPAAVITWNDAIAYCRWLSELEQATYRLPTEAEWEYACRAGTTTQYSFGDDHQELVKYGWFNQNSEGRAQAVGIQLPNPFGLHDMHGNLWEWCQDYYDENWYEKSETNDPTGPAVGSQHVIRGGYWPSSASNCRCAHRGRTIPSNRSNHFGFRVALTIDGVKRSLAKQTTAIPLKLELGGQLPSVTNATGVKLGDLDGDGDLDLFVSMLKAPCLVLLNDGRGGFTDSGQQLGDNASFAVAFGDVDGDGDLDAFVCNSDDQANAIWINTGRGTFQRSPQVFPPNTSNDIVLHDVDGDKDLDAVVSNFKGSVEIWTTDGAGKFTSLQIIPQIANTGIALGDLDGDGDADLVMTSYRGDNHLLFNDGRGRFIDSEQNIEHAESTSAALGDLDQDGDLDLFVTGNRSNRVWFNDGHGRFHASEQQIGDSKSEAVELVDLDADHDLDAIPIPGGWSDFQPRFAWLNDGQGRFQKGPALASGNSQSLAIGDLDGDGDADIVFGNLGQPAEVWFNQSNQSTIP